MIRRALQLPGCGLRVSRPCCRKRDTSSAKDPPQVEKAEPGAQEIRGQGLEGCRGKVSGSGEDLGDPN